ncbi:hypothetical protein [Pseudomonas putida]|uniref:hypothetical protein n=1 Tax=Pseudomonas putida TaxID=303 RepID=UPI0013CED994|nr:hypothetical protein [Pseudomonas putida]
MAENEPRDVVKAVNTLFPSGVRIGHSGEVLILEFLDDRETHLEVVFSAALNEDMIVDLYEKFKSHIDKKNA